MINIKQFNKNRAMIKGKKPVAATSLETLKARQAPTTKVIKPTGRRGSIKVR